jgi:hypothetical protein
MPEVEAIIYEPGGTNDVPVKKRGATPGMTTARALLVLVIQRYLRAMLDPTISLLELHKLLYFVQRAGQPLRLNFEKAHYGPYSENLRFPMQRMNHFYIDFDATQGDRPTIAVRLVPSAVQDAEHFVRENERARSALERVFDLIEGRESPHGLELLATVDWLVTEEHVVDSAEIVGAVYGWNDRKRRFTARQIQLAHSTLRDKGWITS